LGFDKLVIPQIIPTNPIIGAINTGKPGNEVGIMFRNKLKIHNVIAMARPTEMRPQN
jgi:hypothetical protein